MSKEIDIEIDHNKKENKDIPKEGKVKKNNVFWKENGALVLIISLSILVSLGALAFLYFFVIKVPILPAQIIKMSGNYIESGVKSASLNTSLSVPSVPKTEESPLNGLLFTKDEMAKMLKNRPVAVMINNHLEARPQSGLARADIVYEAVTESGITRYMAIWWSDGPKKVGPVRSARQYYLEWLSPFDPLFIHDGCAATSDPKTNACGNIYTYNIKDLRTLGYWRTTDRFAPHNEYNSIQSAWAYGKDSGWNKFPSNTESLKFKKDASYDERGAKTRVKIRFRPDHTQNGELYTSEWSYNRDTNLYYHKIGGAKDIDMEAKKQVTAKTVIIEEVKLEEAYDGKGRVIITTIGQGKAKILMDGKIISGTWKKKNRTDRTRYYDSKGEEVKINRGLIWINALPKDQGKFDIIEQ